MVVCKYYMEGCCKFGSRCKFDHVDSYTGYDPGRSPDYATSDRPQGTSILKAANTLYSGQEFDHASYIQSPQQIKSSFAQKPAGPKYNVQEMMQIILKDIVQSEKGGQWQLSCYSPIKDLPNIPGFEDHSPEELRWECYKALQNGSLPLCQAIVQQLYANVAKMNNELKKKDSGYAIIDRWLRESEEKQSLSSPLAGSNMSSAQFYSSTDVRAAASSSFSFTLSQQQPFPSSGSFYPSTQTAIVHASSQNLQAFPPSAGDDLAYSTVEELTEGELNAFKADRFIFGALPTKPPTKALCNL